MLVRFLDIFSVPRRSFFEWLSHFTTNQDETDKLREFSSKEGQVNLPASVPIDQVKVAIQEDLWDYANRPKRTIAEVLAEFKSATIPPEYALDVLPEMRARQFSIASSAKVKQICFFTSKLMVLVQMNPRKIQTLIAIVHYKTIMKIPRKGVATSWLAGLKPGPSLCYSLQTQLKCTSNSGDQVPYRIDSGTLTLPPSHETPVVLVGPGTGIAPLRAMAEERALQQASGELISFFAFAA